MNLTVYHEFSDDLAGEWLDLLDKTNGRSPFLEFDYQKLWWETKGGGEWPRADLLLFAARMEGKLVGLAPLFSTPIPDGTVGLFNVGSIEVSDFLDVIVLPDYRDEFLTRLLGEIQALDLPGFSRLSLCNLLDSSPTLAALTIAAEKTGWQLTIEKLQHSPCITLAADWETYLAGIDKKQRHEIRRKMRRAEESEIPVDWYIVTDPATLDTEVDAFIELMENDGDKVAFLKPEMREFLRRVVHFAFDCGCLQLAFLTVDGQKAAAYMSFDYQNRIWVYNSGLNRNFQSLSPGWVLLGHLLQWAIEHSRSEFDFMRGDEDYKYRFGAVDRFVMRADLQPPVK
ncbi:glycosyl transferase [Leptolinea sp. HRD-7]|nr:glycosyl transferase [Leptolinea sp. HRD-7]